MSKEIEVRKASAADLGEIEGWLKAERQATGEGFYCNWNIIASSHKDGHVHAQVVDGEIVGFLCGEPGFPDIVEIRPDLRGRGYGRHLARWMIDYARREGISVLEIACAPTSSTPFWESMGFTAIEGREGRGGGTYAYLELPRRLAEPSGEVVPYEVRFYPKQRDWNATTAPFRTYRGNGAEAADGRISLTDRAICFDPSIHNFADCVVGILIDGERVYEDKVKRRSAKPFGVSTDDACNYYLDWVADARGTEIEE